MNNACFIQPNTDTKYLNIPKENNNSNFLFPCSFLLTNRSFFSEALSLSTTMVGSRQGTNIYEKDKKIVNNINKNTSIGDEFVTNVHGVRMEGITIDKKANGHNIGISPLKNLKEFKKIVNNRGISPLYILHNWC